MAPASQNIRIDMEKCTGCGLCVKACPFGAISILERNAVIDYENCTLCGACASICPEPGAIVWKRMSTAEEGYLKGDVWVYCEHTIESGLASVSMELLGEARRLADAMGTSVQSIVLGPHTNDVAHEMIARGSDLVRTVPDPRLAEFHDEVYANVLARMVQRETAGVFLCGATAVGRALMPRLAVMLHTGLTADCTSLSVDPESGLLQQTRPALGGNILATIACEEHRPQMATVRSGVFPKPACDADRHGHIVQEELNNTDLNRKTELLSFTPAGANSANLQEADIVVAAGYGVGGPEGIELVRKLSEALGGALAASRAVVDAGWLRYSHQVGQTGTTVQPELYIACGISGAIQHVVGMQNAHNVVAINRDPEAPIIEMADYVLLGDLKEIIPALVGELYNTSG